MKLTDINQQASKVAEAKPRINALVLLLENYGATWEIDPDSRDVAALHYKIRFSFDGAVVTIGIIMLDWQSNSDVVIETMTTLPDNEKRKGFGTQAVGKLLQWAKDNNLIRVCATQVCGIENEIFWEKNGFIKLGNCFGDFLRIL